jgi:predicted acetyltransferase
MPKLVTPDALYQRSFLAAVEEFRAAGDEQFTGLSVLPPVDDFPGEVVTSQQLADPSAFAAFVARLGALADPRLPLPDGIVPSTQLWWVEGLEYLGRLSIRHSLTPWLLDFGGHIGYGIRPSARRRGHATGMFLACLPVANRLGIDPALLTCDVSNLASRKVIEAAGGVLEDRRGEKLRFWVPTSRRAVS